MIQNSECDMKICDFWLNVRQQQIQKIFRSALVRSHLKKQKLGQKFVKTKGFFLKISFHVSKLKWLSI